jgi:acyl-CoA synthetase (AMP-forming)/AMP-acid ligase II
VNVCELIAGAASSFGGAPALVDAERPGGARTVTYEALYREVRGFAWALGDRGLEPGDRVAILMDNSIELVVTEWACLVAGFVWVAVNSRTSAEELSSILADCSPALLLAGEGFENVVRAARLPAGCEAVAEGADAWRSLFESPAPEEYRPEIPDDNAAVRIRYTSGTAGKPKGAVLTRGCYDASVENVAGVLGELSPSDTVLQIAPMTHASGAMFLPHVAVGARAVLLRHFDDAAFARQVERWNATAVFLVPTMLIRILERLGDGSRFRSLKSIVYGGASMPVDRLRRAVETLGAVFVQIYGLTESTWPVCALSKTDHLRRDGESNAAWEARLHSCGRPTPVGELRIVDEHGNACATGQTGEIRVRGRNTMKGYWHAESVPSSAVSDPSFKGLDADGWMHTGDLGFRDVDGFVTIVDRLHDMIVSGGFNVYPREVEAALSGHPAVLESAVVGVPNAEWGETVHADVVLRPGSSATERELIEHCAAVLPGYKKPRSLVLVDALPKNAAGKVLRREVRTRISGRAGAG